MDTKQIGSGDDFDEIILPHEFHYLAIERRYWVRLRTVFFSGAQSICSLDFHVSVYTEIFQEIYLSPNWWWITYWCIDNIAWAQSQQSSLVLKKQKRLWWILLSAGRLLCPSRFIYDMATHNSLRFGNGTNSFEHTIWKRLLYITFSITATSIYTVLHIGFKKTTVRS